MAERRRIPIHIYLALAAVLVSAYAVSDMFTARADRSNLDACRDGVVAAAELPEYHRPSAVARACAPLVRRAGCRDAFAAFAASDSPARLGTLVRACRDVYCPSLAPPAPQACSVGVPSPHHAEELLGRVFREEHGGTDDAALLGRTLAAALGAPRD